MAKHSSASLSLSLVHNKTNMVLEADVSNYAVLSKSKPKAL